MATPDLLGIPEELRELIYTEFLGDPSRDCFGEYQAARERQKSVKNLPRAVLICTCNVQEWYNMAVTCRQLWHEICAFWGRYSVQISTGLRNRTISSKFQCLCRFTFFRPRISVTLEIGFYRKFISSEGYSASLAICRYLAKMPNLPHVGLRLTSNEHESYQPADLDTETAALAIIAYLTPFRLLAQNPVRSSHVSIDRKTIVSTSWEKYNYLAVFVDRLRLEMEGKEVPTPLSLEVIPTAQSAVKGVARNRSMIRRYGSLFRLLGLYSTRVNERSRETPRPELVCETCGIELWYLQDMPRHLALFHGVTDPIITGEEAGDGKISEKEIGTKGVLGKRR
ncbi:hypothetical protein V8F20_010330 [Naviculisporaceae sp. PSN 640]